jgi:actin-related protein 6
MEFLVGDQVENYLNGSLLQFSRPFERGYLVNWPAEIDVWNRILCSSSGLNINAKECQLVLTEAPFNPESLQNDMNEVVFEDFGFREYTRKPSAWFSAYEFSRDPPPGTEYPSSCTVVDSGFSFSYSMPFQDLRCHKKAVSDHH